jgi:hypothetical protein
MQPSRQTGSSVYQLLSYAKNGAMCMILHVLRRKENSSTAQRPLISRKRVEISPSSHYLIVKRPDDLFPRHWTIKKREVQGWMRISSEVFTGNPLTVGLKQISVKLTTHSLM